VSSYDAVRAIVMEECEKQLRSRFTSDLVKQAMHNIVTGNFIELKGNRLAVPVGQDTFICDFTIDGDIMSAITVEDLFKMQKLNIDELTVGLMLTYRGDTLPYVSSTHLITKGKNKGLYLLPSFVEDASAPTGKRWNDIPGNEKDTYTIVSIEKGRKNVKTGAPLADLIVLRGNGYADNVRFGLHPADVCAKFYRVDGQSQITSIAEAMKLGATEHADRLKWEEEIKETGW
jgi:hypothetical protein